MLDALVGEVAQGVVRAILLGAMMGVTGAALFAWRVAPAFEATDARAAARDGALSMLQLSAIVVSLAIGARLVQQSAAFADTPAQWPSAVGLVLTQTTWGRGWLLQAFALPCIALSAPAALRRGGSSSWALGASLVALCITPALSGHAIGAPQLAAAAVILDAAHVVAAGAWLGTLAVMAAVAIPLARRTTESGATDGASVMVHVLARFSPIALASAIVLAASGLFASWLHLEALPALWTTRYGGMLALKLAILAAVAATGAYNWKVVTPRLLAGDDVTALRRSVSIELALAAALVGVTAVLVATPLPGEM